MWMIQKIASQILDIIFPPSCFLCKAEGVAICESCLKQRVLSYDTPSPVITPLYSFRDKNIKRIIHAIKYFHRKDLIPPLAEKISEKILLKERKNSILIPVPMPLLRKYIRGYNHGEAIAQEISKQTTIPARFDILLRKKQKGRQVTMRSRAERLHNQHDAFQATQNLTGIHVILVDDVTTTGATLLEARKVLLKSGAASVECFTIAH